MPRPTASPEGDAVPSTKSASAPREKPTAWSHARAAFVLFHLVAVTILSLPSTNAVDPRRWAGEDIQKSLEGWARDARKLGFDVSREALESRLFALSNQYVSFRQRIIPPFSIYGHYSGARQGWIMFSSPKRHPSALYVDIVDRAGNSRPLYRPRSSEYTFRKNQLDDARLREVTDRLGSAGDELDVFSEWLGEQASHDYPNDASIVVSVHRIDLLGPVETRMGQTPHDQPIYERPYVFPSRP